MNDFMSLYDESDDFQPTDKECSPLCEQLAACEQSYTDEKVIGKGGMKTVSRVFCCGTQRYVAKATLNNSSDPNLRDAFVREARLTAILEHPNIIKIYEIGISEDKVPYFTMELKNGFSLTELINNEAGKVNTSTATSTKKSK